MPSSTALFLDGPFAGQTREFDRSEPPPEIYVRSKPGTPPVDYVREPNPFDETPKWIYMTKEVLP